MREADAVLWSTGEMIDRIAPNRRSVNPRSAQFRRNDGQRSDGWAQKKATKSPTVFTPPRNGFELVSRIEATSS